MFERVLGLWRVFAVALGFVAFGLGGLVLGLLVFPLLNLAVRDAGRRARWAKRMIHHAFRAHVFLMDRLGAYSYEVYGLDRLQRGGLLILANHPSLIDVVLLMSLVDRADCVVKAGLAHNPFMRGPVLAAGYVFNDSGTGLIGDCVDSMRTGNNLIIFPEGTRTPASGLLHLQRGAARIALQGGVDITPVRIHCSGPFLRKGEKWYRLPPRRTHFRIEVCDTIPVARFAPSGDSHALAARHLTDYLTDYFSRENCHATH